jgi:DNA-binding NarL/FixJ family response regulator
VLREDDGSLTVRDSPDRIQVESALAPAQQQKTDGRFVPLEGHSAEANGFIAAIEGSTFIRECIRQSLQSAFSLPVLTYSTAVELEQKHLRISPKLIMFSWAEGNKEANTNALKLLSQVAPSTSVIVLAYDHDAELARTAIRHGAKGYIPVTMEFEIAIEAVRFVLAGGTYVPMDYLLARSGLGDTPSEQSPTSGPITARELAVIRAIQ